jgi:hypothetical protein
METKKPSWMNYLKILVYGIVFAIITFVLTAGADPTGNISGTVSIFGFLLVMYLEYKFMKR